MLLIYWTVWLLVIALGGSYLLNEGVTTTATLNDTAIASEETDTGGLFGSGVSFGRYFALATFGIGLPSSTPSWFAMMFFAWQTIVTSLTVGFIVSSIWDG